jgi:3-oxoacyl-[acyl-carrier-protein] synthase II
MEFISSVLALHHDQLFPVLNYETPDPQCPIHVVRESTLAGNSFVNLNVSPQGQASGVLVRRYS